MEKPISLTPPLIISSFVSVFSLSVVVGASNYIVSDLGGSLTITFYAFALFAIGNVLGVPLGRAFIAKTFDLKEKPVKYLLISCILFFLFSILCGCASNYPVFLIFRFFQGFWAGPMLSLQQELCGPHLSQEKQATFAKITSILFTMGSVFSAPIGTWIAYETHWRWLFFLNAPFMIYLIFFIKKRSDLYEAPLKKEPFDFIGYIFYAVGILSFSLSLMMGQYLDWFRSPCFATLFITGILSFAFFCLWEFIHPLPLLGIKFLHRAGKHIYILTLMTVFAIYFGANFLTSKWLHLDANYTPVWIVSLLVYSLSAALIFFFFIYRFFGKNNPRGMLLMSLIFSSAACFYATQFDVTINFGRILFVKILESIGLVLFFLPILKLSIQDVPQENVGSILGVFHAVRTLFSGLGAIIFPTILQRRIPFYHERLGEQLTLLSPATDTFFTKTKDYFIEGKHATAQLSHALLEQSTTLGLEDVFYLMGYLFVSLIALVILDWVYKWYSKKPLQTPQAFPSD